MTMLEKTPDRRPSIDDIICKLPTRMPSELQVSLSCARALFLSLSPPPPLSRSLSLSLPLSLSVDLSLSSGVVTNTLEPYAPNKVPDSHTRTLMTLISQTLNPNPQRPTPNPRPVTQGKETDSCNGDPKSQNEADAASLLTTASASVGSAPKA
jgi:hypothetical protein